MKASVGDCIRVKSRTVGQHDQILEVVAVLGSDGNPPYRVRGSDGHETLLYPGPNTEVIPKET
ncbi:hypothetical protein BDV26DRAFT_52887 [Aspergillus bertholletiae]|uniref:DUF1918 domain-containing protein n=1 Tax=Aspergillus bertholletiae TaxID=1226010 RepID=A0A5N7AWC7_9EURO|nr:hypothetical protein BDV26DRAFT_52887 [Aspergillus bertholletiae]